MLTKRLAAVVAAVAFVAAGLWIRSARDDGGGSDASGTSTTAPHVPSTLLCITELADACHAAAAVSGADVVVEPAGTTIDRLGSATSPGPVTWATLAPLPELVDELRTAAGLTPLFSKGDSAPVATSTLALTGRTPQFDVLAQHCGGTATWACLGSVAGTPWTTIGGQAAWGDIKPAHDNPQTTATGLLTFANATVSFFGRNDIGTADLQSDPYQEWVHRLERSIPYFGGAEGTPFERLLLLPEINVVGTTEAEVEAGAGAHRPELTVAYPDPVAQADAVVVSSPGAPAPAKAAALDAMATTLRANGWEEPSQAPPGGLPTPGVLQALRQLWAEVVR